ncbi:MAG: hypothetical protein RIQ93_173 [Verrucomicrobiota bacterium]|jgi:hypothetical protein
MTTPPLRLGLLLAVLLGLAVGLSAQSAAPAPINANVSDLGFLAGHWQGTTASGGAIEAMWTAPSGDNALGTMRMMKAGKATMYEILVAEQAGAGVSFRVKHFNPGLTGREEKDVSDRYTVIELARERVVLEKLDGAPLRVIWEKRPGGVLAVSRGTQKDGQWVYADLFIFKPKT